MNITTHGGTTDASLEPSVVTIGSKDGVGGKTSLIRQCDVCGMTTAIDLDATPENFKDMQFYGQYVREVSREKAIELWKTAGKCKCIGTLAA